MAVKEFNYSTRLLFVILSESFCELTETSQTDRASYENHTGQSYAERSYLEQDFQDTFHFWKVSFFILNHKKVVVSLTNIKKYRVIIISSTLMWNRLRIYL